ncbi:VWA domain-containing protein [Corynebacterium sp. HS2168-gen11]|uniref:VWA domain-containing protein n=1 Tax=Corynebacterium sp. HS2168-gen11 TaxID=2974027 RepID=UPI00216B28A1|nr:VWA domain-containing protein [Corynebacterium sp. HS2168-gen11]MCS4535050.1 VWA domain-containing protein [Corynebacterium sp. HS2168-gen11]
MGRHSNGESNFKVAPMLIVAVLLLAILTAIILITPSANDTATSNTSATTSTTASVACSQGELVLPVAAESEALAKDYIRSYNDNSPVVNDYCVHAKYTPSIREAGVLLSEKSQSYVHALIAQADRAAAANDWPVIGSLKVGLSATTSVELDQVAEITYAAADNPVAAAMIAAIKLGANVDEIEAALESGATTTVAAAAALPDAVVAVAEHEVPEGRVFSPVSGVVQPIHAVVLLPSDTVSEAITQVAHDFAASIRSDIPASQTVAETAAYEALAMFNVNHPSMLLQPATVAAQLDRLGPTLFVLDTSEQMGQPSGVDNFSNIALATQSIAQAARDLGQAGHAVALWNYSSPLSPGVTRGWRDNINFTDASAAEAVAATAVGFGTGGEPQTHAAILAATEYAAQWSAETHQPVSVVVVTSGSIDDADLGAVAARLNDQVQLKVLYFGHIATDPAINAVATRNVEVQDAQAFDPTLRAAVGLH